MNRLLLLFIGNLNNFFLEFLKDTIEYNVINVLRPFYKIDILLVTSLQEQYNDTMFNKTHDIQKIKDYMNLYDIDYKIIYDKSLVSIPYSRDEYELGSISATVINVLQYYINRRDYSHVINIPCSCFFLNKFNKHYLTNTAVVCKYYTSFDIINNSTYQYNFILPRRYFKYIGQFVRNDVKRMQNSTDHIDIQDPLVYKFQLKLGNKHIYTGYIDIIKKLISYTDTDIYNTSTLHNIYNYYKELRPKILKTQDVTEDGYNKLSFNDFPDNVKQLYYKHQYDKPNICIFVQGQVRTFIYEDVYTSWVNNLIKPLHDRAYNYHFIFMFDIVNDYSWQRINRDKMKLGNEKGGINKRLIEDIIIHKLKIRHFNIFYYNNKHRQEGELNTITFDFMWQHKSQHYKTYKLFQFMRHIEKKKKIEFNYILKLRPDLKIHDTKMIDSITPTLTKYMYYRSDFIYIIPIHLFNIISKSIWFIANPRINDIIKSMPWSMFTVKKIHHNLHIIQYHKVHIYHLLLYNIKSIDLDTNIKLVRP